MDDGTNEPRNRKAPATVVNGTRVTVAFPFSKIALQEPSADVRDLAILVAELAQLIADTVGSEAAVELCGRADALRDAIAASMKGAR